MREYELTVILRADLDDEARESLIGRVVGWIPLPEGEDVPEPVVNLWGRRTLAYPIKKLTEGYYVFIETEMEASAIVDLERNISFNEDILRHLVVRKDD